ncbi:hypothetical protein [Streptomyces mirabilis]|uniref:hypothetical protein n=1 Tax=Streptomyces mirabilis TaxID=68239 RepID=UPI003685A5AB
MNLDRAGPAQQCFQALLVTCLMSSSSAPHPLEHPGKRCFSSVHGYLNAIISHPETLEIHTNTACRIASRLMPVLYNGGRVAGIPGLRFLGHNNRRLRLEHLPTGARLDLVDSTISSWYTSRDMRRTFHQETQWHHKPETEPLWDSSDLTGVEGDHEDLWAPRPCTALRSSIMTRAMSLWYKSDIYPNWMPPITGSAHPRLIWENDGKRPDAVQIGALLTASPIAIPGAVFQAHGSNNGLLTLENAAIRLISTDPTRPS